MSILEAQSSPVNGTQVEARSGDASAVAGAPMLASLANLEDLSLIPPPVKAGKNVQQNNEVSSLPSGHEDDIPVIEMKDIISSDELAGDFSAEKNVASSTTDNENSKLDAMEADDVNLDADVGKITASATFSLRPLLCMLAGPCPEFDLSASLSKIMEEQRELRELSKDVDTPTLVSTRQQAFRDSLQQRIINPENIDVSFESFPYYLRCK